MATWVCGCSTWTIRKLFISGSCGTCRAVCEFPRQRTPGVARGLVNHKLFYSIRIPLPYPARKTREKEREDNLNTRFFSSFFFFLLTPPAAGVRRGSTNGSCYSCRLVGTCGCATVSGMCDERTSLNPTQRNATRGNGPQSPFLPSPPLPGFSRVARRAGG